MKRFQKFALATAVALLMAGCIASAYAADRVYLRNGSDLVCDHQKNLNGRVRLYLTPSDDSYIDVSEADIVGRETVPIDATESDTELRQKTSASRTASAAFMSVDLPALLDRAGAEHHLDPDLLASVVRAESGGRPRVVSQAGAQGLMQLMPGTAADLGVRDSFVPRLNVSGGTTYLDALLMYYHENLALALAAYNAGPAAVDRYHGVPPYPETRRYVERVIHDYNRRKLREARRRHNATSGSSMAALVTHP